MKKLLIVVPLLLAAASARAFEPAYDYAMLRAGVFSPRGSSVLQFGTGLDAELVVGRAFLPYLAGELAAGMARAGDTDVMPGTYFDPVSRTALPTRQRFTFFPLTASVKLILPAGSVQPYIGGGAGLYLGRMEKEVVNTSTTLKDSDDVVGFHATAGATIALGTRLFTGFNAQYALVKIRYFQGAMIDLGGLRATAMLGARF